MASGVWAAASTAFAENKRSVWPGSRYPFSRRWLMLSRNSVSTTPAFSKSLWGSSKNMARPARSPEPPFPARAPSVRSVPAASFMYSRNDTVSLQKYRIYPSRAWVSKPSLKASHSSPTAVLIRWASSGFPASRKAFSCFFPSFSIRSVPFSICSFVKVSSAAG